METDERDVLLWVFVIFSALSVVVISGPYIKKNFGGGNSVSTSTAKLVLPSVVCDFASDGEASQKAKDAGDASYCVCVKNEKVKLSCQESAQNAAYFAQARAQFKSDFCALIKNDGNLKASCEALVSSGIEYLKKQDPGYLANIYTQNNDYDKAIEILAGSEKIKTDAALMLSLALNYAGKGLAEHKEAEYIPKAEALVNKAIALDPNSAEAYRVQGYVYEVKPDFFKAVESYDKSLEKDPSYILSLVGRGHAYNLMGDLNKALEDFQKAAELDKKQEYISVYANLCRLEASRDDLLTDGIKNCQIVIVSTAAGAELKSDAYQILADAYVREKRFDEALAQLENARIVSPQNVNLFVSFANLYIAKENYAQAVIEAKKAIEIDSLKTVAYQALSYALFIEKDYSQAEVNALKGLEVIDKDPSLLVPNKPAYRQQLNAILADIRAATK